MKLADYLATQDISYAEFARKIGVTGKDTVRRYAEQGRIPSETMMLRIVEATDGKVTANDFFGIAA
jgi:transcriptional regulator with XRE-family HTH domain